MNLLPLFRRLEVLGTIAHFAMGAGALLIVWLFLRFIRPSRQISEEDRMLALMSGAPLALGLILYFGVEQHWAHIPFYVEITFGSQLYGMAYFALTMTSQVSQWHKTQRALSNTYSRVAEALIFAIVAGLVLSVYVKQDLYISATLLLFALLVGLVSIDLALSVLAPLA